MKQTRQAVSTVKQSLFLDVYGLNVSAEKMMSVNLRRRNDVRRRRRPQRRRQCRRRFRYHRCRFDNRHNRVQAPDVDVVVVVVVVVIVEAVPALGL